MYVCMYVSLVMQCVVSAVTFAIHVCIYLCMYVHMYVCTLVMSMWTIRVQPRLMHEQASWPCIWIYIHTVIHSGSSVTLTHHLVQVFEVIQPIKKWAEYPAITAEEEAISLPLQARSH